MLHDEVISNPFKMFSLCWCIGITGVMVNYLIHNQYDVDLWEAFMVIQQLISWLMIFWYILLWTFTTPENSTIFIMKLAFLTISGPCLLGLSFYAFYERENLHTYMYFFTFFAWWIFFTVAIYCTFKLTLEISTLVSKKHKKRKLKEHYKSINMRSISSNSSNK